MLYEPKIVVNPKNEVVEFTCDGRVFVFQPGEERILEGFTAYHGVVQTNTGLVFKEEANKPIVKEQELRDKVKGKYAEATDVPVIGEDEIKKMTWNELRTYASRKGVFKVGMKKPEVLKILKVTK